MRDKLTKKRIHVDYLLIIKVLDLETDFLEYQWQKRSNISINRQALAFLTSHKVDYQTVYLECLAHGIKSREDYLNAQIKVANYNIWEDDD